MAHVQQQAVQARSLYRRFLRELPSRSPSLLANPSPLQRHIRTDFENAPPPLSSSPATSPSAPVPPAKPSQRRLEEAEQYIHYLKAQRTYNALLERYNPGMDMNAEDKVRLTARRVGMEMPTEMLQGGKKQR